VLIPFALALFIVYILSPVVHWLALQEVRGRPVPRGVAVLVVYAGLVGGVYVFSVTAVPRLANEMGLLVQDAPVFFRTVRGEWVPVLNARLQVVLADLFSAESEAGVPVMDLNVQVTNALQGAVDAGRTRKGLYSPGPRLGARSSTGVQSGHGVDPHHRAP